MYDPVDPKDKDKDRDRDRDRDKDKGLQIAKNNPLENSRAVIKEDNVFYDILGGEQLIKRLLDYPDLPLSNVDVQQLNANTIINFDQGKGGDTAYDFSDYNRLSGTQGKTNAQALSDSVDLYIDRHLKGSDQVRLIFRGNASTDGQGNVNNDEIAQKRAESIEASFSTLLKEKLNARVSAGVISEHNKQKILGYYNAIDENGERTNTINIGSVYEYNADHPVDTKDRNAEIFMGHADGDRAVLETRYVFIFDQKLFDQNSRGTTPVVHLSAKSGDAGLPKDAFRIDQEANTLSRTGYTDFVIKNLSGGRPLDIHFEANDDLAAGKIRFPVTTNSQEDIVILTNKEKGNACVIVDGRYVANIKLEGGASLDALQIGANTPEKGFEKVQNIFTQEENMNLHRYAKEKLGVDSFQNADMYARVKVLGLDEDGLTDADLSTITAEFNLNSKGQTSEELRVENESVVKTNTTTSITSTMTPN